MPQETSNVMSTYEIIATVIAVIALIQPWAIKLWNTLFRSVYKELHADRETGC